MLPAKCMAVVKAFLRHEPGESAKLSTDGVRLDGLWMGGTGIAQWDKGHVYFNDLGSNAAAKVQKVVAKLAPPGVVVEARTSAVLAQVEARALREASEVAWEDLDAKDQRRVEELQALFHGARIGALWSGIHGKIVEFRFNGFGRLEAAALKKLGAKARWADFGTEGYAWVGF